MLDVRVVLPPRLVDPPRLLVLRLLELRPLELREPCFVVRFVFFIFTSFIVVGTHGPAKKPCNLGAIVAQRAFKGGFLDCPHPLSFNADVHKELGAYDAR